MIRPYKDFLIQRKTYNVAANHRENSIHRKYKANSIFLNSVSIHGVNFNNVTSTNFSDFTKKRLRFKNIT